MRIVFHIGRHRTGTTYIQKKLSLYCTENKLSNVLYPLTGRDRGEIGHHSLARACNLNYRKSTKIIDDLIILLKREIEPWHSTIVFSSEEFQNTTSLGAIKYFIKQLNFRDVSIVCFYREFVDYMISAFRHNLHTSASKMTLNDFFKAKLFIRNFHNKWSRIGEMNCAWWTHKNYNETSLFEHFCKLAQLNIKYERQIPSVPVIGGNLILFKALSNTGSGPFISTTDVNILMKSNLSFNKNIGIDTRRIEKLRKKNNYNKFLEKKLGPMDYCNQFGDMLLPNLNTLKEDVDYINHHLQINLSSITEAKLMFIANNWI